MSFRARLLLALAAMVLVPLGGFAVGVRRSLADRLTTQFEAQVAALAAVIEGDLAREGDRIAARLEGLVRAAQADNRFRAALAQPAGGDRSYLLDYAGGAMALAGLDMLQIQGDGGRILSSGHFRNAYDQVEPALPRLLATVPGGATLVRTRSPDGTFLVLARAVRFRLGSRELAAVGGVRVEREFLTRLTPRGDLAVALHYPGGALSTAQDSTTVASADARVVGEVRLPYLDAAEGADRLSEARVRVNHPLTALREVRRSVDAWFLAALGVTAVLALTLAAWASARISRPLTDLARKTAELDLDRLDVRFATDRRDEIGALSRLLDEMTARLRASAGRLREAERLAAMGELARQVNHDIKNGLVPIRNVLRHLAAVARDDPAALAGVFEERRSTLESATAYLETLARHYARLAPPPTASQCDLNAVVQEVLRHRPTEGGVEIRVALAEHLPLVSGDPIAFQRILDNLVGNAVDSLAGRGVVTVTTEVVNGSHGQPPTIRLTVADTGRGMTKEAMDHAFHDFHSSKPGGTGLGLSIVRRLVLDLGGTLRVATEPGVGSRFTVELAGGPEAGPGAAAGEGAG